jgi:outer membrane protein TolC
MLAVAGIAVDSAIAQEHIAAPPPISRGQAGKEYAPPPRIPSISDDELRFDQSQIVSDTAYSLPEFLTLAAANNPTLRQARLQISGELGKALEAGLYPNPIFAYEGEQIFVDVPGDKDSPGEFQGGVIEQRIVTAGKLQLSREKYLRRARVSEHQAMVQQFKVCNDVRIHFYRALAQAQKLAIRRDLLKSAEDSAVTAQEAFNLGQATRPEVRQANVALQRARLDLLSEENSYAEEFRSLTALVGTPLVFGDLQGELESECPQLTFDEALGRIITQSPEMAAARTKLSVDQITVRREEVEWVPDITIRGGTGYNFEADETTAVAGLRFELPLYDRNQGTVRQARADLGRQRQEIARIELELRDRLAVAYQRYVTAVQHSQEYGRVILPELREAYAELLQSYKDDRVRWQVVLEAQRDYFDARLTQVDNLLEARVHEVLIYGFLLHDGLMAAKGITPPGHIDAVPKPR